MSRLLLVPLTAALVAFGARSTLAAQQRPLQPPGGPPGTGGSGGGVSAAAGGGGGGGEDTAPPEIVLTVPGPNGHVYTEYPTLTVQWCDNVGLSSSTRWIKVNNVTRTSSFNYVAVSGACASLATSTSTTVALALGQNTIAAHICDTSNNCATEYFTVTRHEGPPPIVSLAPHDPDVRDYGRCAAACFAAVYAQGTVPYFTRNTPRSVTLLYNGDRADPQPFIHLDATHGGTGSNLPLYFQLRLQKSDGSFVTFLNGEASLRFAPQAGAALRLGGQFNASANGMGTTGAYNVTVLVGAQYSGSLEEISLATRVIVVNETNAPVARGWSVGGIQRVHVQADGSALITEATGRLRTSRSRAASSSPPQESSRV